MMAMVSLGGSIDRVATLRAALREDASETARASAAACAPPASSKQIVATTITLAGE